MGQDYGTIRLPRETFERHNQSRKGMGITWAEYMNGEAPVGYESEDIAEEVKKLRKTLKDIESRLPRKVAEELQR